MFSSYSFVGGFPVQFPVSLRPIQSICIFAAADPLLSYSEMYNFDINRVVSKKLVVSHIQ